MYKNILIKFVRLILLLLVCFHVASCNERGKDDDNESVEQEMLNKLSSLQSGEISVVNGLYRIVYSETISNEKNYEFNAIYINAELIRDLGTIYKTDKFSIGIVKRTIEKNAPIENYENVSCWYRFNDGILKKEEYVPEPVEGKNESIQMNNYYKDTLYELPNFTFDLDILIKPEISFPINVIMTKDYENEPDELNDNFGLYYRLTSKSLLEEKDDDLFNDSLLFQLIRTENNFVDDKNITKTYAYYLTKDLKLSKFSYKEKIEDLDSNHFVEKVIEITTLDSFDFSVSFDENIEKIIIKDFKIISIDPQNFFVSEEFE